MICGCALPSQTDPASCRMIQGFERRRHTWCAASILGTRPAALGICRRYSPGHDLSTQGRCSIDGRCHCCHRNGRRMVLRRWRICRSLPQLLATGPVGLKGTHCAGSRSSRRSQAYQMVEDCSLWSPLACPPNGPRKRRNLWKRSFVGRDTKSSITHQTPPYGEALESRLLPCESATSLFQNRQFSGDPSRSPNSRGG